MSVVSYLLMSIDLEDKLNKVQRYCIFDCIFDEFIVFFENL